MFWATLTVDKSKKAIAVFMTPHQEAAFWSGVRVTGKGMTQISFEVLYGFQNKGKTGDRRDVSKVSEKAISKTSERPVCLHIFVRIFFCIRRSSLSGYLR